MKKLFVLATLLSGALMTQAQEKVMKVQKKVGTVSATRVADVKQITFLAIDAAEQGFQVNTLGGQTVAVLFETTPVVTLTSGKLTVKPQSGDTMQFEITDIAEILFNKGTDITSVSAPQGFACVLQEGGALLRNIPLGTTPHVYSLDGRMLPTPTVRGGQLRLSRSTLGPGVFIVKVGTFSTKIRL